MIEITAFDHVGIVVRDLSRAVHLFHDVLGGEFIAGGDDGRFHMRVVHLRFPPRVKVELMQPLSEHSHLHAYIEKHGEGFHHVTMFVADVATTVSAMSAAGYEMVDTDQSDPGWEETFLRPSSGFGTLIQLVKTNKNHWSTPAKNVTLDAVLRGDVSWTGSDPPEPFPVGEGRTD